MATYNPRHMRDNQETDSNEVDDSTSSAFASIKGPLSVGSDEVITRSLPSSFMSFKGFQSEKDDIQSQISTADTIRGSLAELDEENEMETEISKENNCFKCKKTEATHFCKSCKEGRNYICHVCLQDHNVWNDDHDVVSLSVDSKRNTLVPDSCIKSSEIPLHLPSSIGKKDAVSVHSKEELVISGDMSTPEKERADRGITSTKSKIVGKKFYNDKLYLDIAKEEHKRKQQHKHNEKLTKYGNYSVRTRSDKKTCVIVGITQLENKSILLADSENSELKIIDNEKFRVTVSHKLPNNPYLMCFVEGNKVIIAFINFNFCLIDLTDGMVIENVFEIKHHFKGIAYSNMELFACTIDSFEIYSETGKQISKIKPNGVTAIVDMCINKEKELVFCADEVRGIVILDRLGNVVDIISENICLPHRLCVCCTGDLFVTEKNSLRVLKVDILKKNANQVERENLFEKESPISLCHDKANNRLIVALWHSNKIHVYTCP